MSEKTKIAIAHGDGIGPEIMDATLKILNAAGAKIDPIEIEIGERVYKDGHSSGIKPEAWDLLRQTKVFFEGPYYYSSRWWLQKFERNRKNHFGTFCQRQTLFFSISVCGNQTPFSRHCHHS